MTLVVAAVPASASAAVRTLSVQDPQGDASALSGPVLDLESVAVRYDDAAGTLRVVWTYYNDVRQRDPEYRHWRHVQRGQLPSRPDVSTDMLSVNWSGDGAVGSGSVLVRVGDR